LAEFVREQNKELCEARCSVIQIAQMRSVRLFGAGERRAAFVKLAVPGALNGDGVARENLRAQIVDQ